jgi:hypothetical protein
MILGSLWLPASASCSLGGTRGYSVYDNQVVVLNVADCYHWDESPQRCPHYWVLWRVGQPTILSDFHTHVGTFEIGFNLDSALSILRQHRFFDMAPRLIDETDVNYVSITIEHCSTLVTIFQPLPNSENHFAKLLQALSAGVRRASTKRTSAQPSVLHEFDYFQSTEEFHRSVPRVILRKKHH